MWANALFWSKNIGSFNKYLVGVEFGHKIHKADVNRLLTAPNGHQIGI